MHFQLYQKLSGENHVGYVSMPKKEKGFEKNGVDATVTGWSSRRNAISNELEFSLRNLTVFMRPGHKQTTSMVRPMIFTINLIAGQEFGHVSTLSSYSFRRIVHC